MARAKTTDEERKIGKEAAEQIEKDKTQKLITDPAILGRVERIGNVVAKFTDEPDLTYTFHVVDSPEINAFSLPGGYVYVNKGLIDFCQSDDELAGVLGHEMAHAAHHHMRQLMAKEKKLDWMTLAVLLAGATTGADVSSAAMLTQVVTLARVNGFGMKFETEADHYAVEYLSKSPYNPVGVLTLMERLAREDAWTGSRSVDLGIYQDHPLSVERAKALTKLLQEKGIPIDRRKVMSSLMVSAKEGKVGDQSSGEVWIGKNLITTVSADGSLKALDRAQSIAARLDAMMDQKVGVQDIRIGDDGKSVWAGKTLVTTVTSADAKLAGKSEEETAKLIQKNLQQWIWKEAFSSLY
jgi:predicted Zn-dependent protease